MAIYDVGPVRDVDDEGSFDDEETVVDATHVTPVELPRCFECGTVVFFDDFSEPSAALSFGLFQGKSCVRAADGHWWYCANFSADHSKYVYLLEKKKKNYP